MGVRSADVRPSVGRRVAVPLRPRDLDVLGHVDQAVVVRGVPVLVARDRAARPEAERQLLSRPAP